MKCAQFPATQNKVGSFNREGIGVRMQKVRFAFARMILRELWRDSLHVWSVRSAADEELTPSRLPSRSSRVA